MTKSFSYSSTSHLKPAADFEIFLLHYAAYIMTALLDGFAFTNLGLSPKQLQWLIKEVFVVVEDPQSFSVDVEQIYTALEFLIPA